jgi:hypothetical protein
MGRSILLRTTAAVGLALCLPTIACGPADATDADSDTDAASGSTTDVSPTTGTAPATTSGADSTGLPPMMTTQGSSDSSDDGVGFVPRPDGGGSGLLPNGEPCKQAQECESGECWEFPGGGFAICSECTLDADCMRNGGPGTCGFSTSPWAVCTDGSLGMWCQGDDGCAAGLLCASPFPGSPLTQCGECNVTDDCTPDLLCAPLLAGGTACVAPGTVANDEFCTAPDDGLCLSTHCTEAEYEGMPSSLFLCGECSSDGDCLEGQVCMPGVISNTMLDGSGCL